MLTRTSLKHASVEAAALAILNLFTPRLFAAAGTAANDLAPCKALTKEALLLVTARQHDRAVNKGQEIETEWDAKSLRQRYQYLNQQMDAMNDTLNSCNTRKAATEIDRKGFDENPTVQP